MSPHLHSKRPVARCKLYTSLTGACLLVGACSAPHQGAGWASAAHGAPRAPQAEAASAETKSSDTPPAPERLTLVAPTSGHTHEVDIFRPAFPSPEGGYPVVLLLDGNRVSQFLRDALQAGTPLDAVYVTLGYQGTTDFAVKERALDFTPAVAGTRTPDPLDSARLNGGAAEFLRFIDSTLKPAVSQRVSVDWRKSTLWGHSYAGLFVLFAMLENPQGYARYIAVDPSLWWHDAYLYQRLLQHQVSAPVDLQLLEANPKLVHGLHGRDPARVALRERLHAALPSGAFEQVRTHFRASHRYYLDQHHASIFTQSLNELLSISPEAR